MSMYGLDNTDVTETSYNKLTLNVMVVKQAMDNCLLIGDLHISKTIHGALKARSHFWNTYCITLTFD